MACVLLVEHDEIVRDLLCVLVNDTGHRAHGVVTKNEALEQLMLGSHALVIVDVTLQDGSGYDVASRAANLGIKTILMTGHPDRAREMLDSKIPHLKKPFPIDQFQSMVVQMLSSQGQPSDIASNSDIV